MLTRRQNDALKFIKAELARTGGVSPSIAEVAVALGTGESNAHYMIKQLVSRGYIDRMAGRARSIEVRSSRRPLGRCVPIAFMGKIS